MFFASRQKKIDAKACEWLMREQDASLNALEASELQGWLEADSAHRQSYQSLQTVWQGLGEINAAEMRALRSDSTSEQSAGNSQSFFDPRKWGMPQLGSAAAALLVAVVLITSLPESKPPIETLYSTPVAQNQVISLVDGSEITLGANTKVSVSFEANRRQVNLLQGQAFFNVSKDTDRPFYVSSQKALIKVVGTRFDVHSDRDAVKVAVEEGIVEVSPRVSMDNKRQQVRLIAGQGIEVHEQSMGEIDSLDIDNVAPWRQGRFVYRQASLAEVIADANRYYDGKITLGAPHLGELEITTAYAIDQVDTMISMLEQSLPLVVHREAEGRVLILPKHQSPKH